MKTLKLVLILSGVICLNNLFSQESIVFKDIQREISDLNKLMENENNRQQYKIDLAYTLFQEARNTIIK